MISIVAMLAIGCKFNKTGEEAIVKKSNKKLEVVTPVLKDMHTPEDALKAIKEGNKRYLNGQFEHVHIKRVTEDSEDDPEPFVTILTCSDCKIPPEILFDQENKNILVLRTPGNVEDEAVMKTLDSAAQLKGMKLVLVLGHNSCSAIRSAIYNTTDPSEESLQAKLAPAIPSNPLQYADTLNLVNSVAKKNVRNTMHRIRSKSHVVDSLARENKINVTGVYYDATSGKVDYENNL